MKKQCRTMRRAIGIVIFTLLGIHNFAASDHVTGWDLTIVSSLLLVMFIVPIVTSRNGKDCLTPLPFTILLFSGGVFLTWFCSIFASGPDVFGWGVCSLTVALALSGILSWKKDQALLQGGRYSFTMALSSLSLIVVVFTGSFSEVSQAYYYRKVEKDKVIASQFQVRRYLQGAPPYYLVLPPEHLDEAEWYLRKVFTVKIGDMQFPWTDAVVHQIGEKRWYELTLGELDLEANVPIRLCFAHMWGPDQEIVTTIGDGIRFEPDSLPSHEVPQD